MAFLQIFIFSLDSSYLLLSDFVLTSFVGCLARISLSSISVQEVISLSTFWQMKMFDLLSLIVGVLRNLWWLLWTLKIYLLAGLNFFINGSSAFLTFSLTNRIFLLGDCKSFFGPSYYTSLGAPFIKSKCFLSFINWSLTSTLCYIIFSFRSEYSFSTSGFIWYILL